jgi:hypothetical protein
MIFRIVRGVILGVIISVSYLSCSSNFIKADYTHKKSSPELEGYREYIYDLTEGKLGNPDFSVGFIKERDNLLGECTFVLPFFNKEIDIVGIKWLFLSQKRRILLIAHEYRHCECDHYYHINDKFKDGCPKSYFNEYLPDDECVESHYVEYLSEIKRGCDV